jgi:hypothetical protein
MVDRRRLVHKLRIAGKTSKRSGYHIDTPAARATKEKAADAMTDSIASRKI